MIGLRCLFAGLICGLAAGCGAQEATLSGNVSFEGKPVVYGSVVGISKDKQSYQGAIESDGTYVIENIPRNVGELKLTVHSPDPLPVNPRSGSKGGARGRARVETTKAGASARKPISDWFPIPEKYARTDQSGLKVTID